jgi:surface polysaccharide O-acyltransferase-like enzyme
MVLLGFDCFAALLFGLTRRGADAIGHLPAGASTGPGLFLCLSVTSAVVYVPLALAVSPLHWTMFGPFAFQTNRLLHYLAYFLIGVGVGRRKLTEGVLAPKGMLACRWRLWMTLALTAFVALIVDAGFSTAAHRRGAALVQVGAVNLLFVVSCAASCLMSLAVFTRFANSRSVLFDSLARNAYGIYLVHSAFVSWLQFALVRASLPGGEKLVIVFAGATAASWGVVSCLRRVPAVARVL